MENASRALLITSGVLIGVLILSLAVYLFAYFGSTTAQINSQVAEQQIVQFNTKFTSYEGQKELTIYDVITVAGYAKENNLYHIDNIAEYEVIVYLINPIKKEIQDYSDNEKISLIQNDKSLINASNTKLPTYECNIESYHSNGRVHKVIFTKK